MSNEIKTIAFFQEEYALNNNYSSWDNFVDRNLYEDKLTEGYIAVYECYVSHLKEAMRKAERKAFIAGAKAKKKQLIQSFKESKRSGDSITSKVIAVIEASPVPPIMFDACKEAINKPPKPDTSDIRY